MSNHRIAPYCPLSKPELLRFYESICIEFHVFASYNFHSNFFPKKFILAEVPIVRWEGSEPKIAKSTIFLAFALKLEPMLMCMISLELSGKFYDYNMKYEVPSSNLLPWQNNFVTLVHLLCNSQYIWAGSGHRSHF